MRFSRRGLSENEQQQSAFEKDQQWDGAGVPNEPAPSAQELLGPDIAKTAVGESPTGVSCLTSHPAHDEACDGWDFTRGGFQSYLGRVG